MMIITVKADHLAKQNSEDWHNTSTPSKTLKKKIRKSLPTQNTVGRNIWGHTNFLQPSFIQPDLVPQSLLSLRCDTVLRKLSISSTHCIDMWYEHFQTCSEVFFKRMNFPSTSISSIEIFPVAEAEWEMLTLLLASDSSTSILFLFPLVVRTLRLDEARETVTREDGPGESLSLNWRKKKSENHGTVGVGRDL